MFGYFRAVVLVAVLRLGIADTTYDCNAGCLLDREPGVTAVCGANGVTYINRCLALCSGTTVAQLAPCGAPAKVTSSAALGARAAAAAADDLLSHPIGQYFAPGPASGARAAAAGTAQPQVVTARDMQRFAAEGMVLAGAARLGRFHPKKPEGDVTGSERRPSDQMEIYTVRVLPAAGLVYVSSTPQSGVSKALESGLRRQTTPAKPPTAQPPATAPSLSPAGAAAAAAPYPIKVGDNPDWTRVQTFEAGLPLSAVGVLDMQDDAGWGQGCTGTVFGSHAVLTAAHCVYDRDLQTSLFSGKFSPHTYCKEASCSWSQLTHPLGQYDIAHYDYLAGWKTSRGQSQAWFSDLAVIAVKQDVGAVTGTMGFGYNQGGYIGRLDTAGYPGETTTFGELYRLAGVCTVRDVSGKDGKLNFKMFPAPRPKACGTACAISEKGQSGQAAWTDDMTVRAVLSRGPPTGTCNGYDTYTQIDKVHYDFMAKYVGWAPASN